MDNRRIFSIKISNKNGDKIIDSDLSHILFAANNPRFTLIPNQNINLIDFLKQDGKTQVEILKKLINCEGDFSDFYSLVKSINDNGFMDQYEQIFVIRKNNNDFIVVEGNRRVMCLKLLLKLIKIPKYNETFNIYSNEKSFLENENDWRERDSDNEEKERRKNYDKISSIISNNKLINKYKEITFTLIENDNDLWKFIYDKHLTGQRIGMRKWSRAKHFANLIKWFGIDGYNCGSEEAKNISKKINRNIDDIKKDFWEAQFIYACFYFGKGKVDKRLNENEVNFQDNEILNELCEVDRISALERNHSFNKVRNIIEEYLQIDSNDHSVWKKYYLNITFTNANKIEFHDYKYKSRTFLNFLYDKWKLREITTRPFKNKNKILHEILFRLNGINTFEELSYKQLNEINEFECTLNEIDDILKGCAHKRLDSKYRLERFEYAKSIKLNFEKLCNKIKNNDYSNEPQSVFKKLIDQLNWNSKDQMYLNAVCCSLRSFYEQILIWINISLEKNPSNHKKLVEDFAKNEIQDIKKGIINEFNRSNKPNSSLIYDYLSFLKISDRSIRIKCQSFLNEYLKRSNSKYYNILNEGIHASHRLYYHENYLGSIKIIATIAELTNKLFNEIKWNVFDKLNEEIRMNIRKHNDE